MAISPNVVHSITQEPGVQTKWRSLECKYSKDPRIKDARQRLHWCRRCGSRPWRGAAFILLRCVGLQVEGGVGVHTRFTKLLSRLYGTMHGPEKTGAVLQCPGSPCAVPILFGQTGHSKAISQCSALIHKTRQAAP